MIYSKTTNKRRAAEAISLIKVVVWRIRQSQYPSIIAVKVRNMAASVENIVYIETNVGEIAVELYYQHAPKTCYNFLQLAKIGYYDGTIFHRIIANFMIQGGDPTGTGRGGESVFGGKFEDEITPELRHTGAGILSMANSGPGTNGSQFFITLAPTPWLDGKHTIFGRVLHGMKIVRQIGSVATGPQDRPLGEIKIIRAGTTKQQGLLTNE